MEINERAILKSLRDFTNQVPETASKADSIYTRILSDLVIGYLLEACEPINSRQAYEHLAASLILEGFEFINQRTFENWSNDTGFDYLIKITESALYVPQTSNVTH